MQAEDNEDRRRRNRQIQPPNHPMADTHPSASGGRRRSVEPPPKPNPRILLVLLKGIIMGLIITLFFLLLGIAAIALFHFLIAGGAFHIRRLRRSPSQFLPDSVAAAAYSAEELHRSLASVEYSEAETAEKECAICLDRFKMGALIRRLPDCRHTYHSNCVERWLMRVANCPICRRRVVLNTAAVGGSRFSDGNVRIF